MIGASMAAVIRGEEPEDRPAMRAVVAAAFGRRVEADLVDRLRSEGDVVLSLIAVEGDAVVGHVLFSRMGAPFRALGLAPVSVRPDRQGRGIGSALIEAGLARAAAAGWQGVFVLGEPGFYRRFGFGPALAEGFGSPYAGPYLMVKPLGGALPASRGIVAYARAFQDLE
jgi:putative acetyltransferase